MIRRFVGLAAAAFAFAACDTGLPLVPTAPFAGSYRVVGIDSIGDTAFAGTLKLVALGGFALTGSMGNTPAHGSVRGDSLDLKIGDYLGPFFGGWILSGAVQHHDVSGTWQFSCIDICVQGIPYHGTFTAVRQ